MQNRKKQITEKQRKKNLFVGIGLTFAASLYLGARVGHMMTLQEEPNILFAIMDFCENVLVRPWEIWPTNLGCVFIGIMVAGIASIFTINKYFMLKDTVENAHGDAAFETDIDEYEREFVCDPKVISEVTGIKITAKNCPRNEEGKQVFTGIKAPFTKPGTWKNAVEECRRRSMIYTNDIFLSLAGGWCQRNTNSCVFGASGTGKSRYFLKPNILQGKSAGSVVLTDPSGDIMQETGYFLEHVQGYTIKCLNISDMSRSCRFNPLAYINSTKDIAIIAQTFLDNVKGDTKNSGGDPFWDKAAMALMNCAISYLYEVLPKEQVNFWNVLNLLRLDRHDENEAPGTDSDFDAMLKALGDANPASYAFQQYQTYIQSPIKTRNSILITCCVNLCQLDIPEVQQLTYTDEMELDKLGEKPMAVFLNIPQADATFAWLTSMLYSIMFKQLYLYGENRMKQSAIDAANGVIDPDTGKVVKALGNPEMKYPVRFLIDECANVGKIPNLEKYLATCRKYKISIVPIFQNYSQIVEVYGKDKANNIVSNCDAFLFLGGSDKDTLEIIQGHLGKETVKTLSGSYTLSSKGSNSNSKQQTGKDLMTRDQIETMSNAECLLFIRALRPFKTKKYDLCRHENYRYLSEGKDGQAYLNPFIINGDYEDECKIEAVRIKSINEEGYVKPKTVHSARRDTLVATTQKRIQELNDVIAEVEKQLAVWKPDNPDYDKYTKVLSVAKKELEAKMKIVTEDAPEESKSEDTKTETVVSGVSIKEELMPSDQTKEVPDGPKQPDVQERMDFSDAIDAVMLGGYASAYEFDQPESFSLDKFVNNTASTSSDPDVKETVISDELDNVADALLNAFYHSDETDVAVTPDDAMDSTASDKTDVYQKPDDYVPEVPADDNILGYILADTGEVAIGVDVNPSAYNPLTDILETNNME